MLNNQVFETEVIAYADDQSNIGAAVCAIGAFDGVHKGHRFLIGKMIDDAKSRGVKSVIVTFDIDPDELFKPLDCVKKVQCNEDRIADLASLGADYIYVLPFTREFANHSAVDFLNKYILSFMRPQCIHVGFDFRLGRGTDGNVDSLLEWGKPLGCACTGYELLIEDGQPVTATRIRHLIEEGSVREASKLLTKPFSIAGMVVHGRGEGGDLFNIPTANVHWDVPYVMPKLGVYGGYLVVNGVRYPAAINCGVPPTFKDRTDAQLEVHILNFTGDIYEQNVSVEFVEWLREPRVFKDFEELKTVIGGNIEWVRNNL